MAELTTENYTQIADAIDEVVTGPTTRKPRQTRIRLDRFRPTSTGYRLLSEGSSSDA